MARMIYHFSFAPNFDRKRRPSLADKLLVSTIVFIIHSKSQQLVEQVSGDNMAASTTNSCCATIRCLL